MDGLLKRVKLACPVSSYKNWLASKSEDAEGIVGNLDDEVDASNEEDDDVTEVVEGIVDRVFDVSDKVIDFATKPTQYDDAFAKDILAGIKRGSKIANRTIGGVVKGAGEVPVVIDNTPTKLVVKSSLVNAATRVENVGSATANVTTLGNPMTASTT